MNLRPRLFAALILIGTAWYAPASVADDEFRLTPNHNVRRLLVHHNGKVVTLQTVSGKELTGTVTTVGEHLVQLSSLSGREFYDAMVDYDHIEAVILKVRDE